MYHLLSFIIIIIVAWRHQAITWTNVDLFLLRSSDIHLTTSSQEMPQPLKTKISYKIPYLNFYSNLPVANELNSWVFFFQNVILFSNIVCSNCSISLWNRPDTRSI